MSEKFYGYDLYLHIKKNKKQKLNYAEIERIRKIYKEEYSKIKDKDMLVTLLGEAKKSQFSKDNLSLNLSLGLVGYFMAFVVDNLLFEPIKNATTDSLLVRVIFSGLCVVITTVILFVVLVFTTKKFRKHYQNEYSLFILPYEIELLEHRLNELSDGYWDSVEVESSEINSSKGLTEKDCNENKEEQDCEKGDKLGYLQLIQEPICRMSTTSAIFKGFVATIVAGLAVVSYENVNTIILGLSFLPVVAFAILDVYYLKLEKKYRYLYSQVAKNQHPIDYSMNLKLSKIEIKIAKSRVWDCIKSPAIFLFYPAMIIVLIVVFILKCKCVV